MFNQYFIPSNSCCYQSGAAYKTGAVIETTEVGRVKVQSLCLDLANII